MSLIGTEVQPFKADAFQAGKDFFEVTEQDLKGKWSIVVFYPADFSFVCPTELEDVQKEYAKLKELGVEVFRSEERRVGKECRSRRAQCRGHGMSGCIV